MNNAANSENAAFGMRPSALLDELLAFVHVANDRCMLLSQLSQSRFSCGTALAKESTIWRSCFVLFPHQH